MNRQCFFIYLFTYLLNLHAAHLTVKRLWVAYNNTKTLHKMIRTLETFNNKNYNKIKQKLDEKGSVHIWVRGGIFS